MNGNDLTNHLKEYIVDKEDQYAVMITGPWGCGKTHYLTTVLPKELSGQKIARVSLYGLSSRNDFFSRAIEAVIPKPSKKEEANGNKKIQSVFSVLRANWKSIPELFGVNVNLAFDNETVLPLFLDSETVVILDDFERCGISNKDILGIINDLVENQHCKLIVVCDERIVRQQEDSKLDKKDAKDISYDELKEKVVWKTFEFLPDIGNISKNTLKDLMDKHFGNINWENSLLTALKQTDCHNIRAVKKSKYLLREIGDSVFFTSEDVDACVKADVLADLLSLLLLNMSGYNFVKEEAESLEREKAMTAGEHIAIALSGESKELKYYAKNDNLPFINTYANAGAISKKINEELWVYAANFYPLGEVSRKVVDSIRVYPYYMEANQLKDTLDFLFDASKTGHIPLASIIDVVKWIDSAVKVGDIHSTDRTLDSFFGNLSSWTKDDPQIAKNWLKMYGGEFRYGFTEAHIAKYLEEFHAHNQSVMAKESAVTIDQAISNGSIPIILEALGNMALNNIIQVDPQRIASIIPKASIEDLHALLNVLRRAFSPYYGATDTGEYKKWTQKLQSLIETEKTEDGPRSYIKSIIINDLNCFPDRPS